jgi:hypothetical protein
MRFEAYQYLSTACLLVVVLQWRSTKEGEKGTPSVLRPKYRILPFFREKTFSDWQSLVIVEYISLAR